MAPVIAATRERLGPEASVIVHTGQHYDRERCPGLLRRAGDAEARRALGVGSDTHARQTARIMTRLRGSGAGSIAPTLILVGGDVNSTAAVALCAAKEGVALGHVESGTPLFDRTMPEEVNRVVTDHLSTWLFLHSPEAEDNLRDEGVSKVGCRFVGNTMIDTLVALEAGDRAREAARRLGLAPGGYLLVTLHRPALVDGPLLGEAVAALRQVAERMPVSITVHPQPEDAQVSLAGIELRRPGRLPRLPLARGGRGGGADGLGRDPGEHLPGIACFTLRDNTERPVTLRAGTNKLLGLAPARIAEIPGLLEARSVGRPEAPEKWDGRAARRVADIVAGW